MEQPSSAVVKTAKYTSGTPSQGNKFWNGRLIKDATIFSVAFSQDGNYIASASSDDTIAIWNAKTRELKYRLTTGHSKDIWSVAFSPNSQYMGSGSVDNTIGLWRVETGELITSLEGHTNSVWTVAFSRDGTQLVSGSADKTIRLWNVENIEQARADGPPLLGHTQDVWSVQFMPDGKSIVSGSADLSLRWWPSKWEKWPEMACDRLKNHPLMNAPETLENVTEEMVKISEEAREECDLLQENLNF